MIVRVELSTMSGCKCVRHRGDDVCCSVVFGTLVGVLCLVLCGPSAREWSVRMQCCMSVSAVL